MSTLASYIIHRVWEVLLPRHVHAGPTRADNQTTKRFAKASLSQLVIAVVQIVFGAVFASPLLASNGAHDLGDSGTTGIGLVTSLISQRSKRHLLYCRLTNFSAAITYTTSIAAAIWYGVIESATLHKVTVGTATIILVGASASLSYGLYRLLKQGSDRNSQAHAKHLKRDCRLAFAALATAITAAATQVIWLSRAGAIVVSLLVIRDNLRPMIEATQAAFHGSNCPSSTH